MYYVDINQNTNIAVSFVLKHSKVIQDKLSFINTNEAFSEFLNLLKFLDNSNKIRIYFEAKVYYENLNN